MAFALLAGAIVLALVVLPSVPWARERLSRSLDVPPQALPSGVLLLEWTVFTQIPKFEEGREALGGSATLVAVSDSECEFRFNNYWSSSDVGWPRGLDLVGSLNLEPDSVLRVRLWTSPSAFTLAAVLVGLPAVGCVYTLLSGVFAGDWGGLGSALLATCATAAIVATSISGARRFGEDAVRWANQLEAGA